MPSMKEPKLKTVYVCSNCGETSPRWMGRCPSCGSWNTMHEDVVAEAPKAGSPAAKAAPRQEGVTSLTARRLADISTTEEKSRIVTGITELDRVLGGGIVLGGVVLLSGEPGVGKSTMLLQLCGAISDRYTVLYITGEESVRQVKLRAARLDLPQDNIYLAAENDVDEICGLIEKEKPDLVVIDSIQTMRCADISSSSGTVSQVKESTARLLAVAKKQEIPMFLVGHVNKDGAIAGPKVMEHIVDTVLYFEGDKMLPYRILRAAKNRYGSTNELGMFDMTGRGLTEIANPSQMLLEGRPLGVLGQLRGLHHGGDTAHPQRDPGSGRQDHLPVAPAGLHRLRLQPGQSVAGCSGTAGRVFLWQPGRLCQHRRRHCPAGHFL